MRKTKSNQIKRLLSLPTEMEDEPLFFTLANAGYDCRHSFNSSQSDKFTKILSNLYDLKVKYESSNFNVILKLLGFPPQSLEYISMEKQPYSVWGIDLHSVSFLLTLNEAKGTHDWYPHISITVDRNTETNKFDDILNYLIQITGNI